MKHYPLGKWQGTGMIVITAEGNLNRIEIQEVTGLWFISQNQTIQK